MKIYCILALVLALSQISCLKNANTSKNINSDKTIESKSDPSFNYNPVIIGDSLVYKVDLNEAPIHIETNLEREDQFLKIELENTKGKSISGKISSDKMMNVRFNNILLKGKSVDGPFGKDLSCSFGDSEQYSLVIGKSLMADGSQIGKLSVDIIVK